MIYDLLENVGIYGFDDALLVKAFEYVRSFDASTAEGKHEIVGEDLYAMVLGYETKEGEDGVFEAHRRYIDIMVLIEGEERVDVVVGEELAESKAYGEAGDAVLYHGPKMYSSVVLRPGRFALLYPQDIHRPARALAGSQKVRKLVLKARCVG